MTVRRSKVHIRPIPLALLAAALLTTGCQRSEALGPEAQAPAPARIDALAAPTPAFRHEPVVVTLAPPVPSAALVLDAAIDLPFALPTAVAGIALAALYAPNGWIGSLVAPFKIAFTPYGILVALIFVVFDVEVIFLYSWAVAFPDKLMIGFVEALTFIGILVMGYMYAWRKKALEWR